MNNGFALISRVAGKERVMASSTVREYDYPVWATQGGGLARSVGDTYIFIEKPDCPGLDVGDNVPKEWGVMPVNALAKKEMDESSPC